MNFPRYRAGPIEYWLAEAGTQFINGFIASFKVGASVGVLSGGGMAASELGSRLSPLVNALVAVGSIVATCASGGVAQVHDWHKTNPVPNPWPRPTGNTQPPFPHTD